MKYYGYKEADKAVLEYDITKPDVLDKLDDIVQKRDVDLIIGANHFRKPPLRTSLPLIPCLLKHLRNALASGATRRARSQSLNC